MALLVVVSALVGLGAAFVMAGRERPSNRSSATGRVALLDVVTEHERRAAPSPLPPPPGPSRPEMASAPPVTRPEDPDFLLVSTTGPGASDDLLSLPGLGASTNGALKAAVPTAAASTPSGATVPSPPVPAPTEPNPRPTTRAAAPSDEPRLRLGPNALDGPAARTEPVDHAAPTESPVPPTMAMYSVDRYALLRRIESLEQRTDAHSREWAKSLRARLDSGSP